MLGYKLISNFGDIINFMFNLFIINIRHLNLFIRSGLNCLIISYRFSYRNSNSHTCCMLFFIISLIRNIRKCNYWFIVYVIFLNRYFFYFNIRLWFILSINRFNPFRTNYTLNIVNRSRQYFGWLTI